MNNKAEEKNTKQQVLTHAEAVVTYILSILFVWIAVLRLYGEINHTDNLVDVRFFGSKLLGLFLIIGMILAHRFTDMKVNWKGVSGTREDLKKSLIWGLVMGIIVTAVLFGFRQYLNTLKPENREVPAFGLYLTTNTRWFYPVNIPFQEFFIKCFIQDNFRKLFPGRHKHLSVLMTSALFFVLHLQYPFHYMVGAALLCLVTGYLYEKYPTIWGPVIVHFAIGFLPRSFGIFQIIE